MKRVSHIGAMPTQLRLKVNEKLCYEPLNTLTLLGSARFYFQSMRGKES